MTLEEAIQTLQENAQLLHFEHPHLGIKEAIEVVIEALSQSPLPSDLDEAAEQYADYNSRRWHEDGDVYYHSKILEAFKAGAEWMAEQGVSMEVVRGVPWRAVDAFIHDHDYTEDSIIQIRKK